MLDNVPGGVGGGGQQRTTTIEEPGQRQDYNKDRDRDSDHDKMGRYGDNRTTTIRRRDNDDAQDDLSTPLLQVAAHMVDCRWLMTDRVQQ